MEGESAGDKCLVAYLILASHNASQVARLIERLDGPQVRFFVHVDAKSDIRPFMELQSRTQRLVLLKNRVTVFWGGWSVVDATLYLMREACKHRFRYSVLLSESDYPLKPRDYIEGFLRDGNVEYISFWRLEDRPSWQFRVNYLHYPDSYISNERIGPSATRLASLWYKRATASSVSAFIPRRRRPPRITPYGGAQWWMLSQDAVQYILDAVDENHWMTEFFRFTYVPDEMFFQTVLLNSPLASRAARFDDYQRWRGKSLGAGSRRDPELLDPTTFHYRFQYWSRTKGRPATLDIDDLDALQSSQALFGRKFDPGRSAELLNLVDSKLLLR